MRNIEMYITVDGDISKRLVKGTDFSIVGGKTSIRVTREGAINLYEAMRDLGNMFCRVVEHKRATFKELETFLNKSYSGTFYYNHNMKLLENEVLTGRTLKYNTIVLTKPRYTGSISVILGGYVGELTSESIGSFIKETKLLTRMLNTKFNIKRY